ncbi:MAG: putative short chain dehydrogenase [Microgenomates group bacterium GW2011_GWC1_43_11]|nr:MAG: putative short chain dehydrogenase [Microgenomates group bacterium GW2011_GWC1_43_11]
MKLKNKFAVVTGASTGIGRAIAIELAKGGAFIALAGRTQDKLLKTKSLITENGGQAGVFLGDFTKPDSLEALITLIKQRTDKVDILVNVAGIWHGKDEVYAGKGFESFPKQVILDTYAVGLTAPTLLVHAFIPLMPKGGKIINISGTFENGANEAYRKYFPQYIGEAIEPEKIAEFVAYLCSEEAKNVTGRVFVLKKGKKPYEGYHT